MIWIFLLILLGLFLLVAEVLLVPGITLAGIAGFLLIGYGVFAAYTEHGTIAGHITLVFSIVASVITIVLSLRSKTWKKITLNTSIDSKANMDYEQHIQPGDTGVTIGRLAPMGKATINGHDVEVTALDELVDPQTTVVVVKVEGSKIIVKPKK